MTILDRVMPAVNVEAIVWEAFGLNRYRPIGRQRLHNLAVTAGRNLIRDLLHGDSLAGVTHFAVGTSNTAVAPADTALGAQVFRDALAQKARTFPGRPHRCGSA